MTTEPDATVTPTPAAVPTPATAPPGPAADPRCGRCGYIVRGIASLACPECGADLREVGIDVGRRPGGGPSAAARSAMAILALAFWTAVGYPVWTEATRRTLAALGRDAVATWTVTLSRPGSGAVLQARIDARSEGPAGGPPAVARLTVTAVGDAGTVGEFAVDQAADTYSYAAAGDRVGPRKGVGPAALAEWLARGTGRPAADVDAEARDLALYLSAPPAQHPALIDFGGGRGGSSSAGEVDGGRRESGTWNGYAGGRRAGFATGGGSYAVAELPPAWYPATAAALGLAAWLLGLLVVRKWFGSPLAWRRRGA